ncbi:MAG: hypothetical protein U1D97_03665, partial [Desulfuromonadales bacterium]|nr:hypothetical protein [Desulfuromonadales bacterium]
MNKTTSGLPEKENPYRVVWGAQRFRLSIGWKTLIAFFFIPLIGVTLLVENILGGVARQHVYDKLATSLHSAQAAHAGRLGTINVILSHSASSPAVREALAEKKKAPLVDVLQDYAFNLPFVDAWLVMDTKGNVIARRNGS